MFGWVVGETDHRFIGWVLGRWIMSGSSVEWTDK